MAVLSGGDARPDDGAVLVVNSGSTSLKLNLVLSDDRVLPVEALTDVDPARLVAVGHRVVHGGAEFREPAVLDDEVRQRIRDLIPLAPLHNTPATRTIDEAMSLLPGVPHVAVFDTSFHATLPPESYVYPVPERWREKWGIRRFGFHGLSVEWSAWRAPELLGRPVPRMVVCHLGGGCSLTAVRYGRSVDTTMGFTPMEGVPMVSRSGSIDPGIIFYLCREGLLTPAEVDRALNYESGLTGLGGHGGNAGEIEAAARGGEEAAQLALDVFVHRVAGTVAAMATAAGGLDALVFTAGIGENSAYVREEVSRRLAFLGVEIDPEANADAEPDADVATADAAVRVLVILAREELVIAREVRELLGRRARRSAYPVRPTEG